MDKVLYSTDNKRIDRFSKILKLGLLGLITFALFMIVLIEKGKNESKLKESKRKAIK